MSDNFRRLVSGAAVYLLGSSASKLCLMIFEFGLARTMGAPDFGLYAIASAALLLLSAIAQIGVDYAAIQYLSTADTSEYRSAVARVCLAATTVCALVLSALLFFGRDLTADVLMYKPALAPLFVLTALTIPFQTFNQTASAILRGIFRMRESIIALDALRNVLLLVVTPLAMVFRISPWIAMLAVLVTTVLGSLYAWRKLRRALSFQGDRIKDAEAFRDVFGYAKPLILWSVLQRTSAQLTTLIAAVFLSATDTGVLAVIFRLTLLLNLVQSAVNSAAQAEFAILWSRGDTRHFVAVFHRLSVGLTILATFMAIPVMSDPAFVIWLTSNTRSQYAWTLWPLMVAKLLNVGLGPAGLALLACNRKSALLAMTVYDIVLLIGLCGPLAMFYGVPGYVIGLTVQGVSSVLIRQWITGRGLHASVFSADFNRLVPLVAFSLAAGPLVAGYVAPALHYPVATAASYLVFGLALATVGRSILEHAGGAQMWQRIARLVPRWSA